MACMEFATADLQKNAKNNRDFDSAVPTIHIIGTCNSLKNEDKKPFWKKTLGRGHVFYRKKRNGDKKNKKVYCDTLEISKCKNAEIPPLTTLIAGNSNFELCQQNSVKEAHSIKSTCFSPPLTPEPSLKRNQQNGPLQIAWPDTTSTSGLTINVKPICQILSSPQIASLPVAIFSINGTTRGGKSFLLNQAVKFLKFGKSHPNDWIDQEIEMSFDWSFRMESVTEGIQVWPEPFILEDDNGKKVALILVDNQGLEDTQTTTDAAYKLFCLSNLLSSVFTYCDTQAYTKNYLENLHTFMEFSKSVEHDGRSKDESKENAAYTFGKLILLFRDFRFVKDFPCDDGCNLYDKLAPAENNLYSHIFNGEMKKISAVVRDKRSALLKFYDDILVSTMIGPGNKEPNNTERLHSSTWDPDYKRGIIKFVEKIFSYEFMSQATKKIYGNGIPAHVLIKYIKNWAKIISEKNYNISDITGLESSRNFYYNRKIEESMKQYKSTMDKYKANPNIGKIGKVLNDAIKSIERNFWSDCEYGDWKAFYMEKLQKRISAFSNEQVVLLHLAIKGKRKREKRKAMYTSVGGSALLVGGTITAAVASGGVFIAGVLLASTGVVAVSGASGLLGLSHWKDRKEEKAVSKIADKVDFQLGVV